MDALTCTTGGKNVNTGAGGIQNKIGKASRHLLLQFMSRPLPQRETAEPLSQTKLLSSVSETGTPQRLFTARSDTDKDPEKLN